MKTVFITKAQAVILLAHVLPNPVACDYKWAKEEVDSFLRQVRAGANPSSFLVPEGCKVGYVKTGACIRLRLSGYAHDGGDVIKCLLLLHPKEQEWDMVSGPTIGQGLRCDFHAQGDTLRTCTQEHSAKRLLCHLWPSALHEHSFPDMPVPWGAQMWDEAFCDVTRSVRTGYFCAQVAQSNT